MPGQNAGSLFEIFPVNGRDRIPIASFLARNLLGLFKEQQPLVRRILHLQHRLVCERLVNCSVVAAGLIFAADVMRGDRLEQRQSVFVRRKNRVARQSSLFALLLLLLLVLPRVLTDTQDHLVVERRVVDGVVPN